MAVSKVIPLRKEPRPAAAPGDLNALALAAAERPDDLRRLLEVLEADPQLHRLAAKLARGLESHAPEDLLQCTLERAMRGIGSFRSTGDLLGWVTRIMRNTHIELVRREAREQAKGRDFWLERRDQREADPAELLSEREVRERVLLAWERTSADGDVRLFWRRIYVGLSVEQLIRETGRPRSTVYLMLQRGAAKLVREVGRLLR